LEWYSGVVGAAQTSPPALKIDYDDGDCRWEQVRRASRLFRGFSFSLYH
jgi:hypothetical protein